jgi:uncharacterized protein (DUF488 family)
MEQLFTIGAYGWDPERFFQALEQAQIDLFLDIRRRRGVRGREYAFANAGRLQEALAARGITYQHVLELAPDDATRELQARDDAAKHIARRKRAALGEAFIEDYEKRTLDPFDTGPLVEELKSFRHPVLFCVERAPEACHRHLVAERMSKETGVPVTNLVP